MECAEVQERSQPGEQKCEDWHIAVREGSTAARCHTVLDKKLLNDMLKWMFSVCVWFFLFLFF